MPSLLPHWMFDEITTPSQASPSVLLDEITTACSWHFWGAPAHHNHHQAAQHNTLSLDWMGDEIITLKSLAGHWMNSLFLPTASCICDHNSPSHLPTTLSSPCVAEHTSHSHLLALRITSSPRDWSGIASSPWDWSGITTLLLEIGLRSPLLLNTSQDILFSLRLVQDRLFSLRLVQDRHSSSRVPLLLDIGLRSPFLLTTGPGSPLLFNTSQDILLSLRLVQDHHSSSQLAQDILFSLRLVQDRHSSFRLDWDHLFSLRLVWDHHSSLRLVQDALLLKSGITTPPWDWSRIATPPQDWSGIASSPWDWSRITIPPQDRPGRSLLISTSWSLTHHLISMDIGWDHQILTELTGCWVRLLLPLRLLSVHHFIGSFKVIAHDSAALLFGCEQHSPLTSTLNGTLPWPCCCSSCPLFSLQSTHPTDKSVNQEKHCGCACFNSKVMCVCRASCACLSSFPQLRPERMEQNEGLSGCSLISFHLGVIGMNKWDLNKCHITPIHFTFQLVSLLKSMMDQVLHLTHTVVSWPQQSIRSPWRFSVVTKPCSHTFEAFLAHLWLFPDATCLTPENTAAWNDRMLIGIRWHWQEEPLGVQNLLDCLGSGSMANTCNVEAEMTQAWTTTRWRKERSLCSPQSKSHAIPLSNHAVRTQSHSIPYSRGVIVGMQCDGLECCGTSIPHPVNTYTIKYHIILTTLFAPEQLTPMLPETPPQFLNEKWHFKWQTCFTSKLAQEQEWVLWNWVGIGWNEVAHGGIGWDHSLILPSSLHAHQSHEIKRERLGTGPHKISATNQIGRSLTVLIYELNGSDCERSLLVPGMSLVDWLECCFIDWNEGTLVGVMWTVFGGISLLTVTNNEVSWCCSVWNWSWWLWTLIWRLWDVSFCWVLDVNCLWNHICLWNLNWHWLEWGGTWWHWLGSFLAINSTSLQPLSQ